MKRVEVRKKKAEVAQEEAYQKMLRVGSKYDGVDDATDKQLRHNFDASVDTQFLWMDAVYKFKDAESDLLLAMLEESEAEKDLFQLQWGESVRQLNSVTEAHAELVGQYRELTINALPSRCRGVVGS